MTRILIISDIHANFTALQAVLEAAGNVDATWCLGDLVGYGPDPNECIDLIRSTPRLTCLMGNHDAAAIGWIDTLFFNREARLSSQWVQSRISEDNILFLKSLPERVIAENVTLVHGSPRNPVWEYLLDIQTAAINFPYFQTPLCFVGHTHVPILYMAEEKQKETMRKIKSEEVISLTTKMIINPGSVGQPRDRDKRAAYAIYNPEHKTWKSYRIEYDIGSVQARILSENLPLRQAHRLAEGW
ncbi:MAG: metallophosphoesterase family protein [Anaerolineaceae bacterium]|nr:metallophosphoesterase family protein [Anaerolineaceae bacterium]